MSILNSQDNNFISGLLSDCCVSFCKIVALLAPLLSVWSSQPKAQASFSDFEGQSAMLIVIDLAALFEVCVVGLDFNHISLLVKIDGSYFLTLGKPGRTGSAGHCKISFRLAFS